MFVDGMMGQKATTFLQQIADLLSAKWKMDYGLVMDGYVLDYVLLFFVQHFCVFEGVTQIDAHLDWLMEHLLFCSCNVCSRE